MKTTINMLLLVAMLGGCSVHMGIQSSSKSSQENVASQKLEALFAANWEDRLALYPTWGTYINDPRYNDQWANTGSPEFREKERLYLEKYSQRLQDIDRSQLSGQDLISYDVFKRELDLDREYRKFRNYLMPVSQYNDFSSLAQMGAGGSYQPFDTVKHYEDWFLRLAHIEEVTDTTIANMNEGLSLGYSMPRSIMEKVLIQFEDLVDDESTLEDGPFWKAIHNMPESIPAETQQRLTEEYRDLLLTTVMPAYARMQSYIRDVYIAQCRDSYGLLDLPDGKERYAFLVKTYTTTDITPADIHHIGLQEVARILDEMREVKEEVGFDGDLQAFFEFIRNGKQFYFEDEQSLMAAYDDVQKNVREKLPQFFDLMPRAKLEIRAMDPFVAKTAAGAFYWGGTADGSRPGVFYINTLNLDSQPTYSTETLYLHEAEPGHHFADSLQTEIEDLPTFRRYSNVTAFSEGWALYAESIGREMGMFQDPWQYYGRLNDEQLRAMRLVVDTGLHYYGWARQQAMDYMRENSTLAPSEIESEVERYMANAGQALSYKMGQIAIRDMRTDAEKALGKRFDIKAFHREILIDGALPMGVLKKKMDRWLTTELKK